MKGTRNKRSVWTIGPEPNLEDHFAAFPSELPAICIKAGTSEHGCCAECGAPYARVINRQSNWQERKANGAPPRHGMEGTASFGDSEFQSQSHTIGWRRTCDCETAEIVPATVLDCFLGHGRSGVAAVRLGRNFIGCDLQPNYIPKARRNIINEAPLFVREITE